MSERAEISQAELVRQLCALGIDAGGPGGLIAALRRDDLQKEGLVGHAQARLMRVQDRLLFLHAPEENCTECDESRASVRD